MPWWSLYDGFGPAYRESGLANVVEEDPILVRRWLNEQEAVAKKSRGMLPDPKSDVEIAVEQAMTLLDVTSATASLRRSRRDAVDGDDKHGDCDWDGVRHELAGWYREAKSAVDADFLDH